MRQLLQNISTGEIVVEDIPAPIQAPNSLLVQTHYSVISAGTERAVAELGSASIVGKARARPDLVRKVVESARSEGVKATYDKVRGRLGQPTALGYSSSGVVLEACDDAPAGPGDLVACAGAGYASHAEVVSVPRQLCARVPNGVDPEDAAYSTLGSIALHGFRLLDCQLGEVVGVIGLGLVGQLTLDTVAAAGCVPVGLDPRPERVQLAVGAGHRACSDATEFQALIDQATDHRGADGMLITAASKTPAPLLAATAAARERATVCIVGDVPVELPRAALFSKELRLVVSRSYGPGRYDPTYELKGVDYPAGFVRWTEGRNLEEVLRLMATGSLRPSRLTTHAFDIEDGASAYNLLRSDEPSLGILLRYPVRAATTARPSAVSVPSRARKRSGKRRVGVIGAGAFARSVLLPHLAASADIVGIANATGASAVAVARQFSAELAATDPAALLESPVVDAIVIATRHDSHADLVVRALEAGKDVFVEKPLAITEEQLAAVERAASGSSNVLMVGFNRRFAPLARELRDTFSDHGPTLSSYRVNAGSLPDEHWTRDPEVGGGRIVGEVCHFVDFLVFLANAPVVATTAVSVEGASEPRQDNVLATLQLANGSTGSITYSSLGDASLTKERVEVLGAARAAVLDDFTELTLHVGGTTKQHKGKRDKGHRGEIETFLTACATGEQPWPIAEMVAVTRTTFDIRDTLDLPLPANQ